jgi:hypothetical protein
LVSRRALSVLDTYRFDFSATCAKFALELVGELAQPVRAAEPALVRLGRSR